MTCSNGMQGKPWLLELIKYASSEEMCRINLLRAQWHNNTCIYSVKEMLWALLKKSKPDPFILIFLVAAVSGLLQDWESSNHGNCDHLAFSLHRMVHGEYQLLCTALFLLMLIKQLWGDFSSQPHVTIIQAEGWMLTILKLCLLS